MAGEIGPRGVSAVPTLLELANSPDEEIAMRAEKALTKINPRTGAAISGAPE